MQKITIALRSSFYAYISQTLIAWFAIWAVLASELPLPASLSLFGLLIQVMVAEFISPPPEVLQISLDGKIRYKNKQEQCKKALMVFKPLMIQLTTEQGEIITVWRDSCTETEYRHLLVMVNLISGSER